MKRILFLLATICCLFSCGPSVPPYEYIQSPQGQQMVVVRDNSGMETLMEYTLFMSLMNSGGYNNVINYYHVHSYAYPRYNRAAYSNWRPFSGRSYSSSSYNNYRPPSSGFRSSGGSSNYRNTTPSSSPSFRNTSPSSGSSFRSSSTPRSSSGGFRSSYSGSSGFRRSSSSRSSGFRSSRH